MSVSRLYAYGFAIPRPANHHGKLQWDKSEEFMDEDLAKSGLVCDDIQAYPMFINLPKYAEAAYVIPYFDMAGKALASAKTGISGQMYRMRVKYPLTLNREAAKNAGKYSQPSRAQIGEMATIPYIPPGTWTGSGVSGKRVFIVEGEKKAAALNKRWGLPVIGIGGCGNWHHYDPEAPPGAVHPWILEAVDTGEWEQVVIIPDGDIRRWEIQRQYRGLARGLARAGVGVELIAFEHKIDDWLMANPTEDVSVLDTWRRIDIRSLAEDSAGLIREYGLLVGGSERRPAIEICEFNVMQLLKHHPTFAGQVRKNEDKGALDPPFDKMVEVEVAAHFQSVFGLRKVSSAMVGRCITQVAEQNAYSPLRTWLKGLEWDGVGRLDGWVSRVMGVENSEYARQVGRRAMVAAVARKMEPGCVVDYMVILQGPQGVGKSSVIRELFGRENTLEYVRGGTYESKDGSMAMHGHWCISDEELNTLGMADKNKLKAQITLRTDSYRAPYESKSLDRPRQFVWWGSTNEEEFLPRDSSGYRRFAVLKVGDKLFDFQWLELNRDQLWAEAVAAYDSGEPYSNIDETSAVAEQYAVHSLLYEQVEQVIMEGWMRGPTGPKGKRKAPYSGKDIPAKCRGEPRPWIKLAELATLLERKEMSAYQMAEMGRALTALGFIRLPQLKWDGKNQNVVYLWLR